MEEIQQIIVNEHIDELRHDTEARRIRGDTRDGDAGGAPPGGGRAARVRLGHWLIGVGTAVAGSAADRKGGRAGSAL
jgi:hypothetical protein